MAVTRVLIADLAQRLLAKVQDNLAKSLPVEKDTALSLPQAEAGLTRGGVDPAAKPLSKGAVLALIAGIALLVDVDLPADAAVVLTAAAKTAKSSILCGNCNFHLPILSHFCIYMHILYYKIYQIASNIATRRCIFSKKIHFD